MGLSVSLKQLDGSDTYLLRYNENMLTIVTMLARGYLSITTMRIEDIAGQHPSQRHCLRNVTMQPFRIDPNRTVASASIATMASSGLLLMVLASPGLQAAACRPCAARCAPTSQNPCAATNPCAAESGAAKPGVAGNPCAAKAVTRPVDYRPYTGDVAQLVSMGEALFKDTALSSNNLSCSTCHGNDQSMTMYQPGFANPYPHPVAMAMNQYGLDQVFLDEMIQICLVGPMASTPLPWESQELAALTAYVGSIQPGFKPNPCAANPFSARNPCAAKNPDVTSKPCAAANPCAAKKAPCAAI
jgi:hypothetical protein